MTNNQIISALKKARNVAIFAHRDPDPDACGSMFGLREFCRAIGKDAEIFVKKTKEKYLDYIFPLHEAREDFVAENFDLIVLVDIHTIDRIDKIFQEQLFKAQENGKKFLIIDHHIITENDKIPSKSYKVDLVASSSQMIIDLYNEAEIRASEMAATYIYAGIMGDTDRFLHTNLDKNVFECAMYLLDCGAKVQMVYDYMYRFKTKTNLIMNKFYINNLKLIDNDSVGYLIVSKKDRNKLGMDLEDVKFFSNEIVTIQGVKLSFLCYEKDDGIYKVSLRSQADIYLVDFAAKMGGGGHPNAAGFQIEDVSKKKLEKMIQSWAKEILND